MIKPSVTKNILGGFHGTGIHLFLSTKVLYHIATLSPPQQQTWPSTPSNPFVTFKHAVLTDSSANFNVLQKANNVLNTFLKSSEPLPSPVKKYVSHCTRSIMCLHVCNTIFREGKHRLKGYITY